ncbi:dihydrolipoamide acetyltransferase family protein [Streptomyces zagrosensis]|uniref:Dihydrolipoamide acetyltransferase component of pyruvate dehydrogenase complex n=1 Tax=Streptomyces zagrosensis TaxID=1042984 RepID=A0A7W9UWL1_9ACTN|nr:dihydrolipoamide acetyltransferase family protein [Streptomyces zagrosensis]MBB5934035.1 pyruvate dehydrogenase E2 component (dihydrolipoamide acetyltransferase) [Streptomyces zagrosensis]
MAEVREFALPDLGEGLTEAEIVRWLVAVGDVVVVDQLVVEVETAKAVVEVPCPYGGVVTARFGEEGAELPVGAALLTVAVGESAELSQSSGRSAGGTGGPGGAGGTAAGSDAAVGAEGSGNVLVGYGTGAPAARRRRLRAAPVGASARGAAHTAETAAGTIRPVTGTTPPPSPSPSPPSSPDGAGAMGEARSAGAGSRPAAAADAFAATSAATSAASAAAAASAVPTADTVTAAGASAAQRPVPVISPLVRRLAREHRCDLTEVTGSGPDGLILRSDVERAIADQAAAGAQGAGARSGTGVGDDVARASHSTTTAAATAGPAQRAGTTGALARVAETGAIQPAERIPLRGVRGAVAEKLARSRREIPEATCWVDADATELLAARTAMNAAGDASGGPKISLLAVLARICTAALARFPELNSTVDTEAREIVRLPAVHLGFAAQTDRGLMVPVVRDAHLRDTESLSAEFARLTDSAREGKLSPAELTGGTFTLNNYGVFGVDGSTPIINHPEAAMLGVGRIVNKPWVHGGELAVRRVVQLSLTFDHRVCDGGIAGGFLRHVADCVEQPAVLLRTV